VSRLMRFGRTRPAAAARPDRLLSLWGRIDLVGYAQARRGRCHVRDVWV